MTLCAACGEPLLPGSLAVPVVRIDDDGEVMTGALDFAHQLCPDVGLGDCNTGAMRTWRLP